MISPTQTGNPKVKPRWNLPVGVMEGIVAYNCRVHGFPRPVLAMPMWEGAGTKVMDLSGHGNHGAFVNDPAWSRDKIELDGGNDYIEAADANILDTTGELTLSIWARTTGMESLRGIIGKDSTDLNSNPYSLYFNGGQVRFLMGYGTGFIHAATSAGYADGALRHIVALIDSSDVMRIYVDGVPSGTTPTYSGTRQTSTLKLWLGKMPVYDGVLDGIIDAPLIFNVALTPAQIKFLYDDPYFMFRIPDELYGYTAGGAPTAAIINQFLRANLGADLFNGVLQ